MAFFLNITEFKNHVGGGANVSLEIDSIEPTMLDAAQNHLAVWVGDSLVAKMGSGTGFTAAETAFAPYFLRALAKLTMYEYSYIGGVQFSESGMLRAVGENFQTAYKYQENDYRKKMLESGYEALEVALKYLASHANDFPTWVSEVQDRHNAYFVRYASECRMAYTKTLSRYTYEALRGLVEDVQYFAIEKMLPAALFTQLRTKYLAGNGTTEEKKAILFVQRAIVNLAIEEAIRRNVIQVDGNTLSIAESVGDQASTTKKAVTADHAAIARRQADYMGNRYVSELRKYILANAAAFPSAFCEDDGGTNTAADAWCPSADAAADVEEVCCGRVVPYVDCGCGSCGQTPNGVTSKKLVVL
jgi:hypothetical protein